MEKLEILEYVGTFVAWICFPCVCLRSHRNASTTLSSKDSVSFPKLMRGSDSFRSCRRRCLVTSAPPTTLSSCKSSSPSMESPSSFTGVHSPVADTSTLFQNQDFFCRFFPPAVPQTHHRILIISSSPRERFTARDQASKRKKKKQNQSQKNQHRYLRA